MAAATAVHAARRGVQTLLLTVVDGTAAAGPVAPLREAVPGGEPQEAAPGLYAGALGGGPAPPERDDPAVRALQSVLEQGGLESGAAGGLADLPVARDLAVLDQLRARAVSTPAELLVLDCGPSSSAFRLLALPETVLGVLRRLLPAERAISRALSTPAADAVVDAAAALRVSLQALHDLLTSPGTSLRLVTAPECPAVPELARTLTLAGLYGWSVDGVVVNRVVPGDGSDPWRTALAGRQSTVLEQLRTLVGAPVQEVAFLPTELVDLACLADLGAQLWGLEDLVASPAQDGVGVRPHGDALALTLRLPGARREDVQLGRRGHELVLTVAGHRRTMLLPSALRRCQVQGATLRDGTLEVLFRPDPSLWRSL